jgi:hypothetical protein
VTASSPDECSFTFLHCVCVLAAPAIGVAIGSSTQIALFLIPFVTLLGWVVDQPMSLNFSNFETICLVVSVLMVSALLKNGESNWLQGSEREERGMRKPIVWVVLRC